ncbi:MAG: 50S ribosomal protein L11 methyltransferase [Bacteroidota bacterium]|nr:50S ribosomal protein L11 methyltransferase [Bacteroidota bacterium]
MERYISFHIFHEPGNTELLLADLYGKGFEAFVELEAELQAFVSESIFTKSFEEDARIYLDQWKYSYEIHKHETQDWNAIWEAGFNSINLKDRLNIRAPFHPINTKFLEELIIAPKMAFGTGHHATTSMILEWMINQDWEQKKVLDFGCGTGILGMYAKLRNARDLDLIDNEEAAIENVNENFNLNKLSYTNLLLGSVEKIPDELYDVILANITRNVIAECMADLVSHLNQHGQLVLSGFLVEDENFMLSLCNEYNLSVVDKRQKEDWICLMTRMQ